jgi:hypothetical protein
MEEGIKLVLDLIGMEPKEGPTDWPARPEAIVEKCQSSWACFKQYIRDAGEYVATHVLAVVRLHYLGMDLQRLWSWRVKQHRPGEGRATQSLLPRWRPQRWLMIANVDMYGETRQASR